MPYFWTKSKRRMRCSTCRIRGLLEPDPLRGMICMVEILRLPMYVSKTLVLRSGAYNGAVCSMTTSVNFSRLSASYNTVN